LTTKEPLTFYDRLRN